MPAIETRALRKQYGEVVALGGVDLSVEAGTVFGLQPFAEYNPVTVMVDAVRALFIGSPAGNSVWGAVVWCFVILAVFAPLSAWRYRLAVTR